MNTGSSNAAAFPSDPRRSIAQVQKALADARFDAALSCAEDLLTLRSGIRTLERAFAQAQRLDLLIDLIWKNRDTALRNLSDVMDFSRMCSGGTRHEARLCELKAWLLADETPPVDFYHTDYLSRSKAVAGWMRDLFRVKYKGWDESAPGSFAGRVEALAARCKTPDRLLRDVYGKDAGMTALPYPEWVREVSVTQSFGHVFRDANTAGKILRKGGGADDEYLRRFLRGIDDGMRMLVDTERCEALFRAIDTSRGVVLSTFHHHGAKQAVSLFKTFMPDNYIMHMAELAEREDRPLQGGHRGAAFRAVKALMNKKTVLIAPDGPHFSDASAVEIRSCGLPVRISAGAALLAYEADSGTGWYHVARQDGRFVPVYVQGPARAPGEGFAQFRDRWVSFYAAQHEAALSSSPGDLVFFLRSRAA